MSPKHRTDHHCQHINARGHRCRMAVDPFAVTRAVDRFAVTHEIDSHLESTNGESRPALCAYHFRESSRREPDDETLAAELLGEIDEFSTADSVNCFLGNLVKQLARKRIARRDAIALAYISQLLLNTLPAMKREFDDEKDAAAGHNLMEAITRSLAARLAEDQSVDRFAVTHDTDRFAVTRESNVPAAASPACPGLRGGLQTEGKPS